MEWKDTIQMPEQTRAKRQELFPHGHKDCFECERFVRDEQAQLSFKAGEEKARKVVEWIMSQVDFEDDKVCPYYVLNKRVWQNHLKELFPPELLKEWGIG